MIIRVIRKTTSHKPLKRDGGNEMQTERKTDTNFMYTIDNFCETNKIIFFQTIMILHWNTICQEIEKNEKIIFIPRM